MTINLQNLKEIENELESYTLTHAQLSKIKAIRKIYHRIEEALDNGLTIHLLCDYLNQKGLEISPNYLYLVLHRIRKERGNKSTVNKEPEIIHTQSSVISKNTVPSSSTSTKESVSEELEGEEQLQSILDRYYSVNGLKERYEALGGDIEDFKGKSISDQRQLVNNLKAKITRQLRV
ncbi:hypothetical protein J0V14_004654 [Vibrio parahaemolyticus]|nr:hypothetical protein [Vibrio parahaemolyticus]EHR5466175.1 hypothetical protein [Vibrio parahaemolyticus]